MPIEDNLLDAHARLVNLRPEEVKHLVQFHGKVREGDVEFILKEPSVTDPKLQAIINDPHLEVRSIGGQDKRGEMYYDLKTGTKMLRIKVLCHKVEEEKSK